MASVGGEEARTQGVLACIGLGANLGDAVATLRAATRALAGLPASRLAAASSVYRTAPVEAPGPDFHNAVVLLHTALEPHGLLQAMQRIEHAHGRERPGVNAPRTLDLDLLLYGELRLHTPQLILPHPRMHGRAFVLAPLAEVAPDAVVPGQGAVRDLLAAVAGQGIERLGYPLAP